MNAIVVGFLPLPSSPRNAVNYFSKALGSLIVSPDEGVRVPTYPAEVLVDPEPVVVLGR